MRTHTYLIYFLTLLSAVLVYYGYALMSTIAASVDYLPVISWLASMLHFSISSWLFFWIGKPGRILAIITAVGVSLWPAASLFEVLVERTPDGLIYILPLSICLLTIYLHIRAYHNSGPVPGYLPKIVLSLFPLSLFIYLIYFYSPVSSF